MKLSELLYKYKDNFGMCIVSKITATTATTATKPENVVYFPKKVDSFYPST